MIQISRQQLETQLVNAAQRCELLKCEAFFDQEVRCQLYVEYINKQTECEKALRLHDEGRLGICQRCGCQIAEERLNVLPDTLYCVACAKLIQPAKPQRFR